MRTLAIIGLVLGLAPGRLYVPPKCIKRVEFTKPCRQLSDGRVLCDRVILTADCVATSKPTDAVIHAEFVNAGD